MGKTMIKNLEIKNFKSIKHLALECKKVNLFIGKPNTGKSNILECLGIFSLPYVKTNLDYLVRFENMANLFYDQDLSHNIEIKTDSFIAEIKFEKNKFILKSGNEEKKIGMSFDLDYEGKGGMGGPPLSPFKLYRFKVMEKFDQLESGFLLPPFGDNLLQVLLTNKDLRKTAAGFYNEYGLRLVLKPQEHKIEIQKEIDDVIISYPYALVSDTLQRIVFHLVAIETNQDSILIFEEPEAHAFPFYTKFLAERIALDESNQYFITTHNPYFLLSILEKTPQKDIGIFITYYQDYQTKIRAIREKELPEILDLDASVFFNLDRFLGEG
jgi:AAA15 family ATPase/GTPase